MVSLKAISSTVLEITWEKLNESDAVVTGYRICYDIIKVALDNCLNRKDVNGAHYVMVNITGLNEDTLYFAAVKAGNRGGFGPFGNSANDTTWEDGKLFSYDCVFFTNYLCWVRICM